MKVNATVPSYTREKGAQRESAKGVEQANFRIETRTLFSIT